MSSNEEQGSGESHPSKYSGLSSEELVDAELRRIAPTIYLESRASRGPWEHYELLLMRKREYQAERQDRLTASMEANSARMAIDSQAMRTANERIQQLTESVAADSRTIKTRPKVVGVLTIAIVVLTIINVYAILR